MPQQEIEELVKKLSDLAAKPTLSKAELTMAQSLMNSLKLAGMTNKEISKVTEGRWSESTVKGYTPGINPVSPSPWQDAVSALNDIISAGLTIDDITAVLSMINDLNAKKINLVDVVDFLMAAESANIDPVTLVTQMKELAESGLSVTSAMEAIETKKQLDINGLSLDSLPALVDLAKKYGNQQTVLQVVLEYGSLQELQHEIDIAQNGLEKIIASQESADSELQKTKEMSLKLQEPINAYTKAFQLGFGQKELSYLSEFTAQCGGLKSVFQALKKFAGLEEIKQEVTRVKSELTDYKSGIIKFEAKYFHLTSAINMCEALINEHKFGLDVIATLWSLAGKYGEPVDVLRAVETYGKLKVMEDKYSILEARVTEKETLLVRLGEQATQTFDHLESLHTTALKVGAEVTRVENELGKAKELLKLVTLVYDPMAAEWVEYGPIVAAVAASLKKFVGNNEQRIRFSYQIKSALDDLLKALGGD